MEKKEMEAVMYERLAAVREAEEEQRGAPPPRGFVPVLVGREEGCEERFLLHTGLFNHPKVMVLLEMAVEEFGYEQHGVLRIPCSVEHFRRVVGVISGVM